MQLPHRRHTAFMCFTKNRSTNEQNHRLQRRRTRGAVLRLQRNEVRSSASTSRLLLASMRREKTRKNRRLEIGARRQLWWKITWPHTQDHKRVGWCAPHTFEYCCHWTNQTRVAVWNHTYLCPRIGKEMSIGIAIPNVKEDVRPACSLPKNLYGARHLRALIPKALWLFWLFSGVSDDGALSSCVCHLSHWRHVELATGHRYVRPLHVGRWNQPGTVISDWLRACVQGTLAHKADKAGGCRAVPAFHPLTRMACSGRGHRGGGVG